jgi:ubiquinone/menaquinone biosynthesis C-methylase UbiE
MDTVSLRLYRLVRSQALETMESLVGAGNEEQFKAWNGDEGQYWAKHPAYFDEAVRSHQQVLMEAAAILPNDRVLDIGCGNGESTHEAARVAVNGTALGIDISAQMIRTAQTRASREGLTNASFVQGDAQVHAFAPQEFDVALSRFGLSFLADQVAALTNIRAALRRGGRLVMISWRSASDNEWISSLRQALLPHAGPIEGPGDAPGPFRHAVLDEVAAILTAAKFDDINIEPLDTPFVVGRHNEHAFSMLGPMFGWMVADLDAQETAMAFERMRETLRSHESPHGVSFGSAAWLISARHG